ncbi:hypothetical protein Tco_0432471 [Tanacetum coccineum]
MIQTHTSLPHPSEDQPQTQTDPSHRPSPSIAISDSNPEGSGGNHGGLSSSDRSLSRNEDGLTLQSVYDLCISLYTQVSAQAKEIKALKAQVKKLKKRVKPLITHHKAWIKSVALKTRLARKTSLKKKRVQKEYVSKQGRKSVKSSKGEPSVHKDAAFDDLDDDAMDYMETEDDQDKGRKRSVVLEEKERQTKRKWVLLYVLSSQMEVFDKRNKVLQARLENKQKEKEKGVEIRNVEDTKRTKSTSTRSMLTLKPLPKIDPKDKGKKMIDEEDEVVARKVQKNGKLKRKEIGLLKRSTKGCSSLMSMIYTGKIKFLLRASIRRKRQEVSIKNKEQNFFMIPLLHKGNFLLNKGWTRQIKRDEMKESKDPEEEGLKKRVVNEEENSKGCTRMEVVRGTVLWHYNCKIIKQLLYEEYVENGNEEGFWVMLTTHINQWSSVHHAEQA